MPPNPNTAGLTTWTKSGLNLCRAKRIEGLGIANFSSGYKGRGIPLIPLIFAPLYSFKPPSGEKTKT